MTALHVVIQPRPERAPHPSLGPVYGLFDVVVDGVNITARIGEGEALTLLCDLAESILRTGDRPRQTLQLHASPEAWELGLEADGQDVLLTVFRSHPTPTVAVWERRVRIAELQRALLTALSEATRSPALLERKFAPIRVRLTSAHRALDQGAPLRNPPRMLRAHELPCVGAKDFRLGATIALRTVQESPTSSASARLERADLHSLLVQGTLRFELARQEIRCQDAQLFLDSELLLAVCEELLTSVEAARPIFRRTALSQATLTLRWSPEGDRLEARVRCEDTISGRDKAIFATLGARELCNAVIRFAQSLCDAFVASDPQQLRNLRLKSLAQQANLLAQRCNDHPDDETLTNPHPAGYKCYAAGPRQRRQGRWDHGGKMRFVPRWVATVPSIDLAATFLCGDRLIIGSHRETACIDRQSGHILWRQRTARARCVVSPSGLLRIEPNGHLSCLGLDTGECRFEVDLLPRPGTGPAGSVVDTPGLPKLFTVTEGDRHVTAIDLNSGNVQWRYAAPRAATFRTRRAGKLLLVAGKDPTLVALDIATGEVVWRLKQRLPFTGEIALDRDSIFALTGANGGRWAVLHIEAWTGNVLWTTDLEDRPHLGRFPLVTPKVVAITTRDEQGSGIRGYDRSTGALLWEHAPGLVAPTTAWLAVDDCILANSATGVLLCLDAHTGAPRFNHVFSSTVSSDQPRRLEPILRSGALFVPQHQVHVLRPRDGEILGTLPSDLIPDLIRVDERCDVYVAEESGHVAAFGVAPRLSLVK